MAGKSGVWRGTVTRITDAGVFIRVARQTGHEYGPVEIAEGLYTAGLTTALDGMHAHALQPTDHLLAVGDSVLVAFLEGRDNDPVVITRLRRA